jgi:DNA-binding transcriptional MerR regulator
MTRTPEEAVYSIAAVSKLTGASCHALRVWERRYGFPIPQRSASGHRRYTREQVHALRSITSLSHGGRPIGELIAEFLEGRLAVTGMEDSHVAPEGDGALTRLVESLIEGDLDGGEAAYRRLTEGLDPIAIVSRIIGPAWIDAGERWFRRESAIYQERIVSSFLGRKLEVMIDVARRENERPVHTIVIGTIQGDRHQGGVLMLNVLLEHHEWRVFNLGVDLPTREYLAAIKHWNPDALALSFVLSRNIKKRFQELSQIRGLPIFVGGRSILNYQGLARRHGLIPLPGPLVVAVAQLRDEYDQWVEAHKPRSAS